MKIIALTMMANENEIVESFIRYNFSFIDKMIIVSSCCIDNTLKIVRNLIQEGYNIELIEESEITFNQRYLDNKYLKYIASNGMADLIIPLDADEFIAGEGNPREVLEAVSLDKIYEIKWKNYAMRAEDDYDEPFIPKRLCYMKKNFLGNDICKVLIPARMIFDNEVVIQVGHHAVNGRNIETLPLNDIYLAHFPCISKEQYLLKLYESSVKFITWSNREYTEGFHSHKQLAQFEAGRNVYKIANDYGFDTNGAVNLEYAPLSLEHCTKEAATIRYGALSKVNLLKSMQRIGQLMAIKAYILELERKLNPQKKNILIFGVGVECEGMFSGIPEGYINIRAYIDNNPEKQFRMYRRRLVIPLEFVRFFKYDKILISSQKYYDEMTKDLTEIGVKEDAISNIGFIFDLMHEEDFS